MAAPRKSRPPRPTLRSRERADLNPDVWAYARALGWRFEADPNAATAVHFHRPGEVVWFCARGWAFARHVLDAETGTERCVDHRFHCHCGLGLLAALEDSGPGPGTFHLFQNGKRLTRRPVGRGDERILFLHAYGLGPGWRSEMAVGAKVLCGRRVGGEVVQYTVVRVT